MPLTQIPTCRKCHKPLVPIASKSRPQSSEWYCPEPCHTSHPMDIETARIILQQRASA